MRCLAAFVVPMAFLQPETAHAAPEAADFVDNWVNVNPETDGMTRCIISLSGTDLAVHGFGACSPSDCDWGVIAAPFTGNPFTAVYEQGFVTNVLTICLPTRYYLFIHSHNVFHDGTGRDYSADYMFHPQDRTPDTDVLPESYVGTWVDMYPASEETDGLPTYRLTRVTIEWEGDDLVISARGACRPRECDADWGVARVPASTGPFAAAFTIGAETRTFLFRLFGGAFLHADGGRRAECVLRNESSESVCCPGADVPVHFVRGDSNADGRTNVADAVYVLGHLFAGGLEPSCRDAADSNDDGGIDVADVLHVLGHLFGDRTPPPDPFERCGVDPTGDALSCGAFAPCSEP